MVNDTNQWAVESSASRFGVKGDTDLANGLKGLYVLEYGIKVDDGKADSKSGTPFSQRNAYAGVQGGFGTLVAGRVDTPLKTIQTNTVLNSDIDRFNDLALADIGQYLAGENRASNSVLYTSPLFLGGFEAKLDLVQGEESGVRDNSANPASALDSNSKTYQDNTVASGWSSSLSYGKANWFVAVAHDRNVLTTDATRAVGEVVLGDLKLGALYQTAQRHTHVDALNPNTYALPSTNLPISEWDGIKATDAFTKQKGYVLNAAYRLTGPWTVKAQLGRSNTTPDTTTLDDVTANAKAIGVDYKFNDSAKVFGYYAQLITEGDKTVANRPTNDSTAGVGLSLSF